MYVLYIEVSSLVFTNVTYIFKYPSLHRRLKKRKNQIKGQGEKGKRCGCSREWSIWMWIFLIQLLDLT